MTIRKGEPWGRQVARPAEVRLARTDAELADLLAGSGAADRIPALLVGGDLHRTLGGRGGPSAVPDAGASVLEVPIDLLEVRLDDRPAVAAAHVVIGAPASWLGRRVVGAPLPLWGEAMFIANSDHVGGVDLLPRAHPNDGRADVLVVAAAMPWRARRAANARARTGSHLPHPQLAVARLAAGEWTLPAPRPVAVDGIDCGVVEHVTVAVAADAATILAAVAA